MEWNSLGIITSANASGRSTPGPVQCQVSPEYLGIFLWRCCCMMTALRMFGYSQKELVGQNVATIVPEPMASMHQRFLTKYMETGDTFILASTRMVLAVRQGGDIVPMVQNHHQHGKQLCWALPGMTFPSAFTPVLVLSAFLPPPPSSSSLLLPPPPSSSLLRPLQPMRVSSFLPAIPWWPLLPALRVCK